MIGMMIVVGAMLKTSILKNIVSLIKRFEGGGVTSLITVLPLIMALPPCT